LQYGTKKPQNTGIIKNIVHFKPTCTKVDYAPYVPSSTLMPLTCSSSRT
jgi:hypothetical protein